MSNAERAEQILRAASEKAKAMIDQAAAEALAALHEPAADAAPGAVLPTAWTPDWQPLDRAMTLLQRQSRVTAIKLIKLRGLGHLVDGRWRVDLSRVHAYLDRRPYPPIDPAA